MRHQLTQQKFSLEDDISEETNDQQSVGDQLPTRNSNEFETRIERPVSRKEERISPTLDQDITSFSLPSFPHSALPRNKTRSSNRDHRKDYRLSDLVMFGPEYFQHVFNLPNLRSASQQRSRKTPEQISDLDRIKQDLFHRYLWTQQPQVSSRIRPLSTYTRDFTFVS